MTFDRFLRSARAIILLLAILSIAATSCSKKKEQPKSEEARNPNVTIENLQRIADIQFTRLDGGVDRLSYYRDKVVLLNLWATWNKDCMKEVPVLNEIQAEFQRAPFTVLGVAIDGQAALNRYVAQTPIKYPVFYGTEETLRKVGGARMLPVTFILMRDGTVSERLIGFQDKKALEDRIKDLLTKSF